MAYPHYVYCTCSLARLASPTCSRVRVHVPVVHIRCRATVEDRYLYEGTVQLRQFTLIRVVQYSTCTVHVRVHYLQVVYTRALCTRSCVQVHGTRTEVLPEVLPKVQYFYV